MGGKWFDLRKRGVDRCRAGRHGLSMSAQEIIAELPKLRPEELLTVKAQVDSLVAGASWLHKPANSVQPSQPLTGSGKKPLAEFLLRVAGTAENLPEDMAENHDHYLYGMPKRLE